jgi:CBS domain-containing protein
MEFKVWPPDEAVWIVVLGVVVVVVVLVGVISLRTPRRRAAGGRTRGRAPPAPLGTS